MTAVVPLQEETSTVPEYVQSREAYIPLPQHECIGNVYTCLDVVIENSLIQGVFLSDIGDRGDIYSRASISQAPLLVEIWGNLTSNGRRGFFRGVRYTMGLPHSG